MEMPAMKVHQLARGFWEQEPTSSPSAASGCAPSHPSSPPPPPPPTHLISRVSLDRKVVPERRNVHRWKHREGGTRWNPTQEQIGILEMLYRGGMRTPNAQQIEHITAELDKYGKIEGKNVFYWFQNHKARERQKQKRNTLGLTHTPRTPPSPFTSGVEEGIGLHLPKKKVQIMAI